MPSCFLAYRKANATLRDRLTGAIDALKNDDFPFELWSDNLLLPGSEWERDIAIRIDEADLFFMLVTTEYSANSYSVETELRRAISRAKQNSGIKIIPIIADNIIGFLGKAEIEEFKYNALPSGGKGISHFGDTAAWIEAVVSGVKRLIHEELAGMQLRPLNLAQEIARYRSSITSGLEAVDSCDGSLGRYTSLVRYALMRAYDTLDIGPETFITSLSPIRKKINDARRAARDAKASEIEDILKDIGVSIDDLQDAANYIVDVDVPVVEPVSPLTVGQFGVLQDRTALDARLTWVESASDVLEDFEDQVAEVDGIFLATASRQIGAESRL